MTAKKGKRRPVAAPLAGETVIAEGTSEKGPKGAWKVFAVFGILLIVFAGSYWYQGWTQRRAVEDTAYNGFEFSQSAEGYWVTEIAVGGQPYLVPFYNHPSDVDHIPMQWDAAVPILTDRPQEVVISVDPDAGARVVVAGVEIARITGYKYNLLNLRTSSALSRTPNGTVDIPVVNCADATVNGTTVIEFVQAEQALIFRDGGCVRLFYTTPEEAVQVADRYAYRLLRIAY